LRFKAAHTGPRQRSRGAEGGGLQSRDTQVDCRRSVRWTLVHKRHPLRYVASLPAQIHRCALWWHRKLHAP